MAARTAPRRPPKPSPRPIACAAQRREQSGRGNHPLHRALWPGAAGAPVGARPAGASAAAVPLEPLPLTAGRCRLLPLMRRPAAPPAAPTQLFFIARRGTDDVHGRHTFRGDALAAIVERAADRRFPLLALAPEATTKAAPCLLRFRRGAFEPGAPVCPVLLRYRFRHFNPGALAGHGWRPGLQRAAVLLGSCFVRPCR